MPVVGAGGGFVAGTAPAELVVAGLGAGSPACAGAVTGSGAVVPVELVVAGLGAGAIVPVELAGTVPAELAVAGLATRFADACAVSTACCCCVCGAGVTCCPPLNQLLNLLHEPLRNL